jgi:hypothetical protein
LSILAGTELNSRGKILQCFFCTFLNQELVT